MPKVCQGFPPLPHHPLVPALGFDNQDFCEYWDVKGGVQIHFQYHLASANAQKKEKEEV